MTLADRMEEKLRMLPARERPLWAHYIVLIRELENNMNTIKSTFKKMPKPQDDAYLIRKADPNLLADKLWGDARDTTKWEEDFNIWLSELDVAINGK